MKCAQARACREEYMPIADKVIQVEMDADLAIYGNL